MKMLLIVLLGVTSLFSFDKKEATYIDSETIELPNGETLMGVYYCYKTNIYIELLVTGEVKYIPVVWYGDGRGQVDCADYKEWQKSNNI